MTKKEKQELFKIIKDILENISDSPDEIQKRILDDYSYLKIKRYTGHEFDNRSWTDLEKKIIYYYYTDYDNPSYNSIFDLLHEIGHIKTNKISMSRYKKELLATQWAILQMRYYGFDISEYEKEEWREYILSFNKRGKCKLDWEE